MYFSSDVYTELVCIDSNGREKCGIVAGRKGTYYHIWQVKNKAKEDSNFKIGLVDKLKILYRMMKLKCDCWAVFHTHKKNLSMSKNDIDAAYVGSINIIISDYQISCYTILKENGIKKAIEI